MTTLDWFLIAVNIGLVFAIVDIYIRFKQLINVVDKADQFLNTKIDSLRDGILNKFEEIESESN